MLRSIMQDARYTVRQWRRAPGFALTVMAVLALGLGANIAVFTLLNGILLRPLPYAHPDRIVSVELGGPMPYYNLTYANMLQLRDAIGPKLKIGAVLNGESTYASIVGPGGRHQVTHGAVTAGLFNMLGVQPVLYDTATSPTVAVVNKAFADKYLPGQNAVGHILSMGKGKFADIRIVGVIADTRQLNVIDAIRPEIYFCLAQTEPGTPLYGIATAFIQVAIRASVPADALRTQFDKVLHEVAPDATTTDVKTIHQAVEDSFGSQKLIAYLLESFAALAVMIASVGLYGLLSFAVAQRTREIGIRMALGAQQASILGLVLRRALLLLAIGLTLGGVLAWFATRFAGSYIYGVRAHDAVTFVAVTVVLATSSFFAAWLPARRAAAVDPILALRSE